MITASLVLGKSRLSAIATLSMFLTIMDAVSIFHTGEYEFKMMSILLRFASASVASWCANFFLFGESLSSCAIQSMQCSVFRLVMSDSYKA